MQQILKLEADLAELHAKCPAESFRAGIECAMRHVTAMKNKIRVELARHHRACQFPHYPN